MSRSTKYTPEQDEIILNESIAEVRKKLGLTRGQVVGRRHVLQVGSAEHHKPNTNRRSGFGVKARFARPSWFKEDIWLLTKGGAGAG